MKDWVKILSIEVPEGAEDNAKPGIVLDGQHRLLGMKQFSPMCMVNVVALLNIDDMEKAFQFLVINNKVVKVSGDLIRTLGLDYQEAELSQRLNNARVSLHDNLRFVGYADSEDESPFKGIVALVGEEATQAQRYVPPSAIESSIGIIQGKKVRELDEDDALCEFFYSVWRPIKTAWPDLWHRDSKLLNKAGIIAMTSYCLSGNTLPFFAHALRTHSNQLTIPCRLVSEIGVETETLIIINYYFTSYPSVRGINYFIKPVALVIGLLLPPFLVWGI